MPMHLVFYTSKWNNNNGRPKAFLNIIFFDEQFKFDNVNSYSEQIGTVNPGQVVVALGAARQAKKNGYCYIYISNESDDMVYFDNFTLKHERSAILEETHYYPFGLTMAGISSKAAVRAENKLGITGKERQSKEFSDGSGLEEYDFGARFQDPQIGRWMNIDPLADANRRMSPYAYVGNNPNRFIDPDGMFYYELGRGQTTASEKSMSETFARIGDEKKSQEIKNEPYDYSSQAYETADAAAAGWIERYGEYFFKKSSKEWSSVIYSFTSGGKEYYGYSKPVSWHDKDPNGNDASGSSPGWSAKYQRYPTTFAFNIVGHIHLHTPKSGTPTNPKNEDFSRPDGNVHRTSPNMDFYLASPTNNLIVQRGRDVVSFGNTFESDHARLPLGQVVNGKFQPVAAFTGSLSPIYTGAPRDNIYGISIKKK